VKPILDWMKKNVVAVVCIAVMVISLPTAWLFSTKMNTKLRTAQQSAGEGKLKEIKAKATLSYEVAIPDPAHPPEKKTGAPNQAMIDQFKALKDKVTSQATEVIKKAEDFNRGVGEDAAKVGRAQRKPLVEGLFPGPKSVDELEEKCRQFFDLVAGKPPHTSPYMELLRSINAGPGPDRKRVEEDIAASRQREIEKTKTGERQLTREEEDKISKLMGDRRLGMYQQRAREISVYATINNLPKGDGDGRSVPTPANVKPWESERPEVQQVEAFVDQWDLWVVSDVLSAVRLANSSGGGAGGGVENSVVKRIEKLSLSDPKNVYKKREADPYSGMTGGGPQDIPGVNGMAPFDPQVSITGRLSSSTNDQYDVREVTLRCVVASARLPEFLDAISRTNLMTVIDLDLSEVDAAADLARGYYFGNDHVVRATIKIESIWLRSWMAPLMPHYIKEKLGVKVPGEDAGAVTGTPTGAPPSGNVPTAAPPPPEGGGRGRVRPPG
jgi:hypothetical protein